MAKLLVQLGSVGVPSMSNELFNNILDEQGNLVLNEEGLAYLEAKYSDSKIPDCPTCGKKLELASVGGTNGSTYACANVEYPVSPYTREEYKAYEEHYVTSRFVPVKNGDRFVITLLNAYKELLVNPVPDNKTEILNFLKENPASTVEIISREVGIPLYIVRKLIVEMKKAGILSNDSSFGVAYDTEGNAVGHYRYIPSPAKWSVN
jgi:hypothetical protein